MRIPRSASTLALLIVLAAAGPAHAGKQAGEPDRGFGHRGILRDSWSGLAGPAGARRVEIDEQGRLIALGFGRRARLPVARYLPDGSRDGSFGGDGLAIIDTSSLGCASTNSRDLALDRRGNILVSVEAYGCQGEGSAHPVAIRLTDDGVLDPAFGDGGVSIVPSPPHPNSERNVYFGKEAATIGADRRNRVIMAGANYPSGRAVRLTPGGAIDRSFGRNGYALGVRGYPGDNDGGVESVASIAPSGAVTFAGFDVKNRMLMTRLLPSGSADAAYGRKRVLQRASEVRPSDMVASSGGFVIAATTKGLIKPVPENRADAIVLRVNRRGKLDMKFGDHGYRVLGSLARLPEKTLAARLALDSRGRILAAGTSAKTRVMRLGSGGNVDRGFGRHGTARVRGVETVTAVAVGEGGGRPLLAGSADSGAAFERLLP